MSSADAILRQKVHEGSLIESVDEMTEEYKRELKHIVMVSGDTELLSAPAYYYAARKAPSVNAMISAHGDHPGRDGTRAHRLPHPRGSRRGSRVAHV